MLKMLLYCTKNKPNIVRGLNNEFYISNAWKSEGIDDFKLNGKIVGECNFEVEEIALTFGIFYDDLYTTKTLNERTLLDKSKLTLKELADYLGWKEDGEGYAIHIKNLKIYDEPRELRFYHSQAQVDFIVETELWRLKYGVKAPQNMCYAYNYNWKESKLDKYVLISIRPQWLCKILNGEKTIEVRKKVLKEMINND